MGPTSNKQHNLMCNTKKTNMKKRTLIAGKVALLLLATVSLPAAAQNQPEMLGAAWIGLTDRIGIHGTSNPQGIGRDDNRGTICLGDRDLQDLFGILSVGSRVTVVR